MNITKYAWQSYYPNAGTVVLHVQGKWPWHLCKELTQHSLPEIGDAFGGRDHTTVLHACRKIAELCETDGRLREDKVKLLRLLTA